MPNDTKLLGRIARGLTTADDALAVDRMMARLARLEQALFYIATHGASQDAMRATRALIGDESCQENNEEVCL